MKITAGKGVWKVSGSNEFEREFVSIGRAGKFIVYRFVNVAERKKRLLVPSCFSYLAWTLGLRYTCFVFTY